MNSPVRSLQEITAEAIHLLCKEMGVVNTIRFINQFSTGYGNYTEEREEIFKDMSIDDIFVLIDNMKKNK